MPTIVVDRQHEGERIDKYLIDYTGFSRSKIQKLIANHDILVNAQPTRNSYLIKSGDTITIDIKTPREIKIEPENIPLDIIYEDDDLLVVNKPANMVVHPAAGHRTNTLVNALLYHCNSLSNVNGHIRPGIVHRLDKDTSGLLLVAKNDEIHHQLARALQENKIVRKYIALVEGIINNNIGTIDAPIGRDPRHRKKMAVTAKGRPAITHFRVIKRLADATLVECELNTGRTHQIRVHLKYINHPIINDPIYNPKKIIDDSGQLLHAYKLEFNHPRTNEYMEFEALLPTSFIKIMEMFKIK
ncbi:MAG: RluA family pseudouridine synthase [Bacilli bacterium]|jgi:23S rRNA pseudouridine1911/1915/1917 synthase